MIKEPLEIDFYVDPRPMTDADRKAINKYIKADKVRRAKKSNLNNSAKTPPPKNHTF